jgi:hypothetical protein
MGKEGFSDTRISDVVGNGTILEWLTVMYSFGYKGLLCWRKEEIYLALTRDLESYVRFVGRDVPLYLLLLSRRASPDPRYVPMEY